MLLVRFVSPPPRCHGDESFWSQALQDLETCGQSEILRELEASMTGSTLSLYLDETRSDDSVLISPVKREQRHHEAVKREQRHHEAVKREQRHHEAKARLNNRVKEEVFSPTALELHKVTVHRDGDFGFSVSDGLLEKGVFVNMIRPDGPAHLAGVRPYDRLLQVNGARTRDMDCCLTVPLIAAAGDRLELVISRSPPATGGAADTTASSRDDLDVSSSSMSGESSSLLCFPADRRTNSVAL